MLPDKHGIVDLIFELQYMEVTTEAIPAHMSQEKTETEEHIEKGKNHSNGAYRVNIQIQTTMPLHRRNVEAGYCRLSLLELHQGNFI